MEKLQTKICSLVDVQLADKVCAIIEAIIDISGTWNARWNVCGAMPVTRYRTSMHILLMESYVDTRVD